MIAVTAINTARRLAIILLDIGIFFLFTLSIILPFCDGIRHADFIYPLPFYLSGGSLTLFILFLLPDFSASKKETLTRFNLVKISFFLLCKLKP